MAVLRFFSLFFFFLFTDLVICFWQVRQWVGVYGRQQDEATGTVKPVFMSPIPSQHDICCVITTPFYNIEHFCLHLHQASLVQHSTTSYIQYAHNRVMLSPP